MAAEGRRRDAHSARPPYFRPPAGEGFFRGAGLSGREAMDSRPSTEELARSGVTVHIPPALRSFTDGQDEVLLEVGTVTSLLKRLDDAFPGIRGRILDETGRPRPYVNVFVNDELVREPLDRVSLVAGDVVHILPSVAGGSLG